MHLHCMSHIQWISNLKILSMRTNRCQETFISLFSVLYEKGKKKLNLYIRYLKFYAHNALDTDHNSKQRK